MSPSETFDIIVFVFLDSTTGKSLVTFNNKPKVLRQKYFLSSKSSVRTQQSTKMSAKNRYLGKLTAEQQQQQLLATLAEDKLFKSLKRHIVKEREHKKQLEAETAKEEQLRNEREARKKQDNMTLGKTQQEIAQVEEQLVQLKNKKHQLFLQLKALITKEVEMEKIRKEKFVERFTRFSEVFNFQIFFSVTSR